jgi:hypothetical protein
MEMRETEKQNNKRMAEGIKQIIIMNEALHPIKETNKRFEYHSSTSRSMSRIASIHIVSQYRAVPTIARSRSEAHDAVEHELDALNLVRTKLARDEKNEIEEKNESIF